MRIEQHIARLEAIQARGVSETVTETDLWHVDLKINVLKLCVEPQMGYRAYLRLTTMNLRDTKQAAMFFGEDVRFWDLAIRARARDYQMEVFESVLPITREERL